MIMPFFNQKIKRQYLFIDTIILFNISKKIIPPRPSRRAGRNYFFIYPLKTSKIYFNMRFYKTLSTSRDALQCVSTFFLTLQNNIYRSRCYEFTADMLL